MNPTELTKTKAGRRLMGFMKVFNQGQTAALQEYVAAYTTEEALARHSAEEWQQQLTRIYTATGPMRAMQIIASDEYHVVVLMQSQAGSAFYLVDMTISEDYPHKIAEFIHRPA